MGGGTEDERWFNGKKKAKYSQKKGVSTRKPPQGRSCRRGSGGGIETAKANPIIKDPSIATSRGRRKAIRCPSDRVGLPLT